jgi:2'-5' RNA ligase
MMSRERLFFGVPLLPEVAAIVALRQAKLRAGPAQVRLVPEENLHLTTRFIGDADPADRERILAGIDERAFPASFSIRLSGWGAFPRPGAAKVLWVGIDDPSGGLQALHEVTNRAAVLAGFAAENRPYKPHLTIGRLRVAHDVRALLAAAEPIDLVMRVSSCTLFRSITRSGHPVYEPICSFTLEGHESLRTRES